MAIEFGISSVDAEYFGLENPQQIEEYDLANFQISLTDSIANLSSDCDNILPCVTIKFSTI